MKAAKNLQQLKIWAPADTVSSFREACAAKQLSMASVLAQYMLEFSGKAVRARASKAPDYSTRKLRQIALMKLTQELELIREGEARSRDNTPANLQGSERWERSDEAVTLLEDAIDLLKDVMVP